MLFFCIPQSKFSMVFLCKHDLDGHLWLLHSCFTFSSVLHIITAFIEHRVKLAHSNLTQRQLFCPTNGKLQQLCNIKIKYFIWQFQLIHKVPTKQSQNFLYHNNGNVLIDRNVLYDIWHDVKAQWALPWPYYCLNVFGSSAKLSIISLG